MSDFFPQTRRAVSAGYREREVAHLHSKLRDMATENARLHRDLDAERALATHAVAEYARLVRAINRWIEAADGLLDDDD